MSKIDEQLEIEKKKDIQNILSQGLSDLGIFCETIGTNNQSFIKYFKSDSYNITIEIRDSEDSIIILGLGKTMSHLLSIDTIQKAYNYIKVLRKHLTEEPVKEFKTELQKYQVQALFKENN